MREIDVIFIAPYAELKEDISSVFLQMKLENVRYKILVVEPEKEERIEQLDGDVIIARGFTAAFFREQKIPIVEMNTAGYDLIMAVYACIKQYACRQIALIGTLPLLFYDTCNFNLIFPDIQIKSYPTQRREQVEQQLDKAIEQGAEAVIGGRTLFQHAQKRGIPCTMIRNSRESIRQSIEMAIQLAQATRAERTEKDRIAKIMDYSFSGILSTNRLGEITDINRKACSICNMKRESILGRHINQLFPSISMDRVIQGGESLIDEVCRLDKTFVSVNCVPIQWKRKNIGAVITFQEAQDIQKTEANIRKKILQKGFVAHYCFSDIIAKSAKMMYTIERAKRFSANQANVLIYGETGTGKELFAQSIHNASKRSQGPFVAINCAALPEQLLESELFGYVEGAFTGAAKSGKIGLFEAAHKGTIFLDEIGDLSLKLQGRLLRVLQEKEIVRLGDDHVIPIDVRVISATNKDLQAEVEAGNFRSDLMYRLDVLRIEVPPLRERKEDIIPILESFLLKQCLEEGKPLFTGIEEAACRQLEQYPWQGNVRQLQNVAQRVCILCDGPKVTMRAVCQALNLPHVEEIHCSNGVLQDEKERILQALESSQFHRGRAAELLNMDRSTLWRKMKKYDLLDMKQNIAH